MRPPTELERLAVFVAAMAVTRLLLARPQPAHACPPTDPYRARYGANNPTEN